MSELGLIVLFFLIVGGAWFAFSPPYIFKIRIAQGSLRVTKGKIAHDFLQQAGEILQQWKISRGWIGGVRRGRHLTLIFSYSVPPGCRQQIRNLWTNG